jgi:hypothetical protein
MYSYRPFLTAVKLIYSSVKAESDCETPKYWAGKYKLYITVKELYNPVIANQTA